MLIEVEQELNDKRIRPRNSLPSEKMKAGESYLQAASRCLKEELELEATDIELVPSTYHQEKKENASPSYPGLCTHYILHLIEARITSLPSTDFWTAESDSTTLVQRHHWAWRSKFEL